MPFTLNPEFASIMAAAAQAGARPDGPPPGDVFALRATTDASLGAIFARLPPSPDVQVADHTVAADDGGVVPVRWYWKPGSDLEAAVVYLHGGGMVCGSAPLYDPLIRQYVQLSGVPFLSVDYRLAPEYSRAGLGKDALAALRWLAAGGASPTLHPNRIAIMGESGGGGVAAAAAIMARDEGIALARQVLIYPMLDDRNTTPDPHLAPLAVWSYEFNRIAWTAVLGDDIGTAGVSPYAAPARLTDFSNLAPAYVEIGELDIFRDESLGYARGLWDAGISCELHVHRGVPHAYDFMAPASDLYRRVTSDRLQIITSL